MKIKDAIFPNIEMSRHLIKASPKYIVVNTINTIFKAFSSIIQILFYQYIIDSIIYTEISIDKIAVKFLLYYFLKMITDSMNIWVTIKFNEKEKVKIGLYYEKLIYSESAKKKIEGYSSETYLNMLHNAVYHNGSYLYTFSNNVFELLSSIISFVSIFYIFYHMNYIFIISCLVLAAKNIICNHKINKLDYQIYIKGLPFERYDTYIENLFYLKQYVREFRIYPICDYFIEEFKAAKKRCWNSKKKLLAYKQIIIFFKEFFDVFFYALHIIILVFLLIKNKITVGEFSLVLSNLAIAVTHIENVIMFFPNIIDDARYIDDILSVIRSENLIFPEIKHNSRCPYIKCKNVHFSYDGETEILNNINIDIPLNKKIAIVGKNGSGKSTFLKLLLGLYTPSQGKVQYYYPDYAIKNSSELFSIMFQEHQVFALSIADNLLPSSDVNTVDKIKDALNFSGLDEKVKKLENGVNTILTGEFSEDGIQFSGGEKQKLAIARAYAKGNPVLVMDEPSSNLDPIAENKLIEKINQFSKDKAVVFITHNLLYTKNVDLVFFFDKGRIVEYGTPEQLIRKQGYYFNMINEQTKRGGENGK